MKDRVLTPNEADRKEALEGALVGTAVFAVGYGEKYDDGSGYMTMKVTAASYTTSGDWVTFVNGFSLDHVYPIASFYKPIFVKRAN